MRQEITSNLEQGKGHPKFVAWVYDTQQHDQQMYKVTVKTPIQTMNTVFYFKMIFLVNFIS